MVVIVSTDVILYNVDIIITGGVIMQKIKLAIARLRKVKGITQKELAKVLDVSFQAISKWENGTTLPDIHLLPKLARYFGVSVDQLLGLEPLDSDYIRTPDVVKEWSKRLDYLQQTREHLWNEDYMTFLIEKVWRIDRPIDIIDFGCGYGDLGIRMLPLLPEGSTYTGLDASSELIKEARTYFDGSKYMTQFIQGDFNHIDLTLKYDLAICQAVLRHVSNPQEVLQKMVDSVKIGGRVICIEVNRELENANLYIDSKHFNSNEKNQAMQKLWRCELESEGRDYAIGMKLPFYMESMGLHHIDIRISDRVNYISPQQEPLDYQQQREAFIKAHSWHVPISQEKREEVVSRFMNRGASLEEAESYINDEEAIRAYIEENEDIKILKALCLVISSGIKV